MKSEKTSREDEQTSFRTSPKLKADFVAALAKQDHISDKTAFFSSVMKALIEISDAKKLAEWPIEIVVKKKRP